jgi:cytochrome c peroxidase
MLVELILALVIPLGLDLYLPVPEDNPLTVEKIEAGRRLFFDTRLSLDGSVSCATCHDPRRAFSSRRAIPIGVHGRAGRRNAPAIVNRAYGRTFFWDGRTTSLEEQVLKPIEDPAEMGSTVDAAAARVGLTRDALARSLASYVRSILAGNSPFDRFVAGDQRALSADEQAGLRLFRGKASCTACHIGPTLSDEQFHNTGVAWADGRFQDDGRAGVTGRDADRGAFKTPTLREVARTAPYMHDGSLRRLEDVIEFYDRGGRPNRGLDSEIRPLRLTGTEKRSLVAFLRALSGELVEGRRPPSDR